MNVQSTVNDYSSTNRYRFPLTQYSWKRSNLSSMILHVVHSFSSGKSNQHHNTLLLKNYETTQSLNTYYGLIITHLILENKIHGWYIDADRYSNFPCEDIIQSKKLAATFCRSARFLTLVVLPPGTYLPLRWKQLGDISPISPKTSCPWHSAWIFL